MINNFTFKIFKRVLVNFQIDNKLKRAYFFQKTFLFIDTNIEIILKIVVLSF